VGIKVFVREGGTLEAALKRFRKKIWRAGRLPLRRLPSGKKGLIFYQKPGELRRQKEYADLIRKRWNLNCRTLG
jgi:ribosomal protein S21